MAARSDNSILFVIIIYRCGIEESLSYQTLLGRHDGAASDLFVYDNSPYIQTTGLNVAGYVHDTDNGGIGKAYNAAADFAQANGYRWMILMDQDTAFPPNALNEYRKAAAAAAAEMIVPRHKVQSGLYLSPTPYRMKTSSLQKTAPTGIVGFKTAAPINSGTMLTVASFKRAGGYDERVWLDFSDICFMEKYSRLYPAFYVMPEVTCTQTFSSLEADLDKRYKRFRIYLECARNITCGSVAERLALSITVLRPTVSFSLKSRSLRFAKAFWNIYIKGQNHNHPQP